VTELEEAIKVLEDLRRQDPCLQRGRNRELTGSFKVFWNSAPNEETFTKQTDGLLFTNRMIYYMNEHPVWKMDKPHTDLSKETPLPETPAPVTPLTQEHPAQDQKKQRGKQK